MLSKIQRAKFYPQSAADSNEAGMTVEVLGKVTVARDGSVVAVDVSGGSEIFESAARQAVERAAPFGAFPAGLDLPQLKLKFVLDYRLR